MTLDIPTHDIQYQHIRNLRILLLAEQQEYDTTFRLWQNARACKNWQEADRWRRAYAMWDVMLWMNGKFYYPHENPMNTQRRAFIRMKQYSVDIYPWNRSLLLG